MAWLMLALAICLEVCGTLALKASDGLTRPAWLVVTAVTYLASFALLGRLLSMGVPVGVAYAIWSAAGIAAVAALSHVLFGETLSRTMVVGLGLLVVGVVLVELGSGPSSPAG